MKSMEHHFTWITIIVYLTVIYNIIKIHIFCCVFFLLNKINLNNMTFYFTYWKIWTVRNPYQLPSTQYTLKGYSVATLRTNFYIRELGLMLYAGLSVPRGRGAKTVGAISLWSHWDHPSRGKDANINLYKEKRV